MDPDEVVAERAMQQHGLIHRTTAVDAGLSDRQIAERVRSGRWQRLRPAVYRIAGAPRTPTQDLLAATLHVDGTGSHLSAAWMLGLGPLPGRHEVTVPLRSGHRARDVRLHRTHLLRPTDVTTVDGVPTTNATRTCIDLGARLTARQLERVMDRALHARLTTVDRLSTRFLELARPGRNGTTIVREVLLERDPDLAPAESDLETLVLRLLSSAGLPAPVRQLEVTAGGRRFRLDLASPDLRLAIECDGFAHHGGRSAFEDDRERQNLLTLAGWTILRFTWRQVIRRPDWVAAQVRAALATAR
jgi:hypothetical protein